MVGETEQEVREGGEEGEEEMREEGMEGEGEENEKPGSSRKEY